MTTPTTRIFYSWQNWSPGAANRSLIGDALERAASALAAECVASPRPEIETATSNVPGAPSIPESIFAKIEQAEAFVADVSLVVRDAERAAPNPNVLVELGYALHVLGDTRIILVMNTALGPIESLPFDLRPRRVLPYALAPGAEKATARASLEAGLRDALRLIVAVGRDTADVRIRVEVNDVVDMLPTGPKKVMSTFRVSIQNHSAKPVYIASIGYQKNDGTGLTPSHDQLSGLPLHDLFSRPIEPGSALDVGMSPELIRSESIVGVSITDRLGRQFQTDAGAVTAALS